MAVLALYGLVLPRGLTAQLLVEDSTFVVHRCRHFWLLLLLLRLLFLRLLRGQVDRVEQRHDLVVGEIGEILGYRHSIELEVALRELLCLLLGQLDHESLRVVLLLFRLRLLLSVLLLLG